MKKKMTHLLSCSFSLPSLDFLCCEPFPFFRMIFQDVLIICDDGEGVWVGKLLGFYGLLVSFFPFLSSGEERGVAKSQ